MPATRYTLHIPVTQTYLIDVDAGSPQEARALGQMQLAKIGLPPYGDDDGEPMQEEIQFDIIVVSWTDEKTGELLHTDNNEAYWATEAEARLGALASSSIKNHAELRDLFVSVCQRIVDGEDVLPFARSVVEHFRKK